MFFVPSCRDDIIRYYKNTYVKFKEFGEQLFYIQGINREVVSGLSEDNESFVIYLDEKVPFEVDYVLPNKSFFQCGSHATLLQRVPAKQYFRGLSAQNTQASYMSPSGVKVLDLNFELLKQFVKKQAFFTLSGACAETKKEGAKSSYALSPRMMMMKNRRLFVDFHQIGQVNEKEKVVFLTRPVFVDEVEDLIKQDTGFAWKVMTA